MNISRQEWNARLGAALEALDRLGFDTLSEAWRAMRTHHDWEERWDVVCERSNAETELCAMHAFWALHLRQPIAS